MNDLYPENDYRTYLEHALKSHKYISKHRGKRGKWVYVYPKENSKSFDDVIGEIEAELPHGGGKSSTFDNAKHINNKYGGSHRMFVDSSLSDSELINRWASAINKYMNTNPYYAHGRSRKIADERIDMYRKEFDKRKSTRGF